MLPLFHSCFIMFSLTQQGGGVRYRFFFNFMCEFCCNEPHDYAGAGGDVWVQEVCPKPANSKVKEISRYVLSV